MTDVDIDTPPPGAPVIEMQCLRLKPGARALNLTLHKGEVVAVTGLLGSGKTALAQVLFGLARQAEGQLVLNGQSYAPHSPEEAIARGVFLSPKDRASNAVIGDFNIARNMSAPFLRSLSAAGFVNARRERTSARDLIAALEIVCQSETDAIGTLSGGNQQKVMLARWLSRDCALLCLDEPFQGVDIKSRRDIGKKVRATAMDRATLVFVSELDEALEIADRIVVMHDHAIAAEFANHDVDLNAILSAVTGSSTAAMEPDAA